MNAPLPGVNCTASEDRFAYYCARGEWEITFDRFHEARAGDFTAELVVSTLRQPHPGVLSQSKHNLLSAQAHATLARNLAAKQSDTDWGEILTLLCHDAIRRYREGEPAVYLRDVPQSERPRWLLQPYVEYGGPTVLFAMGGVGKSTFALALAAAIASGQALLGDTPTARTPALYLDWESDAETHADRLRAICGGHGLYEDLPAVVYRRQTASLAESVASVRRIIAAHGIGFVVLDSLGAARGGEPESADATIRLFAAARSLGLPWLGVDHMTKNGGDSQWTSFGSIYTFNLSRIMWAMEKAEESGDGAVTIALRNTKANNGLVHKRRAYKVDFVSDADGRPAAIHYEPCNPNEVAGALQRMHQADQIAEMLRRHRGPMLVEEIAQALEAEDIVIAANHIRAVLSKKQNKGRFAASDDGPRARWALRVDESYLRVIG